VLISTPTQLLNQRLDGYTDIITTNQQKEIRRVEKMEKKNFLVDEQKEVINRDLRYVNNEMKYLVAEDF
jgi:hypothetical protein